MTTTVFGVIGKGIVYRVVCLCVYVCDAVGRYGRRGVSTRINLSHLNGRDWYVRGQRLLGSERSGAHEMISLRPWRNGWKPNRKSPWRFVGVGWRVFVERCGCGGATAA